MFVGIVCRPAAPCLPSPGPSRPACLLTDPPALSLPCLFLQDQALPGGSSTSSSSATADVAGSKQQPEQPREASAAPAAPASRSAFAAHAGSVPPEFGTSAGSDAGSFMRQPRGVEAMMGGGSGQRRTLSGALTSPSGLSEHGSCLLVERTASSSSAHRALLGGAPSPDSASAATATALLELPEEHGDGERRSTDQPAPPAAPPPAGELAPTGDEQRQQGGGGSSAGAAATAAAARRPPGIARPTVLIPSPPAPTYVVQPMASPTSGLVHAYVGATIPIDELDLDAIDDIPSVDACGLSTSSSPTISGVAAGGRSTPGHLRGSRDFDLRRMAVVNSMLSPSMQTAAHISAASPSMAGGDPISISAEGAIPQLPGPAMMFTGATRGRALPGSNTSLVSAVSQGTEQQQQQQGGMEPAETLQLLHALRLSRGNTPSPAANGSSPAQPRSAMAATATPRTATACSSRASSAMGSPVPPPSNGPAAALLAGSVVASPRTPHSPLSAILSPRPNSARVLSAQQTPLPGPLFGSGFGVLPAAGASPGTSPGTSSAAAPSSTASSCCTGSGVGTSAGQPPAGAGAGRASLLGSSGGATAGSRRFASPSPTTAAGDAQQQQQQGEGVAQQAPTQMQQLLRQQLMQHDTRLGPHGGSPLSPSHHQQLPPRGDTLLSPSCPTPLVPPALTSAGSHNRQLADAAAAGAVPAPGTAAAGRTAGGVGHLSIHEWLDHQSWRLPYEVPQGLRDAADVRDAAAAAAAQQQHAYSRMGPGRGPGSRGSSQRNSITNLDSPGALLLLHSPSAGQFPAAAAQGHLSAVPPPALHFHHHQQQQQPGHPQQPAEVLLHRQLAAVQAAQAAAAAVHEHSGSDGVQADATHSRSLPGCTGRSVSWDGQSGGGAAAGVCCEELSIGVSGPLSDVQAPALPADGSLRHPPARTWQQQLSQLQRAGQQQQQQQSGPQASSDVVQRAGLSPVGQYPWPLGGTQRQLVGAAATCAAGQAWVGNGAPGHRPHERSTGTLQVRDSDVHAVRDVSGSSSSSSSGSNVVQQLGAGSHLYPAGGLHLDRPAGCSLCGPMDVREYQQSPEAAPWRLPQSPVLPSPGRPAAAAAGQHGQSDQHVLPGIAQLLQRRHEQQQRRQLAGVSWSTAASPTGAGSAASPSSCSADAAPAAGSSAKNLMVTAIDTGQVEQQHQPCRGRDNDSHGRRGSNAGSVAVLLSDAAFVSRVLSSLPGVDPQSGIVWDTVAELQQALSAQSRPAAAPRQQQPD